MVDGLDDGSGGGLVEMGSNSWDENLVWGERGGDVSW